MKVNQTNKPRVVPLLVLSGALLSVFVAGAAQNETFQFNAASGAFAGGHWDAAERWFGEFFQMFPKSPRRAEAVLLQAQARFFLTNSAGALELLTANAAQAGKWADSYLFWTGEAQFQAGRWEAAAQAYARVTADFTSSPHVLAASYGEALARSKLGQSLRVVELLHRPDGAFQTAARGKTNDEFVARGQLLLAETHLDLKDLPAGEAALQPLREQRLPPELDWRRQYLLCRLQSAEGRNADALQNSGALTDLAAAAK
ncbi:MAG: tetratricopeptide repeat protein, partial [Verrucomicrobia bacterium]|nr:tetratricopeptide repeat protein [Verrucomicrobiota bacterium]